MKKLSLKGLADYMTASATTQRRILRTYKYPSEEEAKAKILYYKDARDAIATYHSRRLPQTWLESRAQALDTEASMATGRRRTRLQHNARGIRQYMRRFAARVYDILPNVTYDLPYNDVVVTVHPDLHVRENGVEKLLKLEFQEKAPDAKLIHIITQAMFEAATRAGSPLPSNAILLLDVPRGTPHRGSRMGSRMARDIEATCANISAIWAGI